MITLKELASLIEQQLNENAHTKAFNLQFKVWADVGDYQEAFNKQTDPKLINAVLRETTGDYTPVMAVKSKLTTLAFELAVNQYDVDNVKIILGKWTLEQIGYMYTEDDTSYIVTPGAIVTGTAVNTCDLGSTVPLSLTVEVQEAENGLISNEMEWTIKKADSQDEPTPVYPLRGQIISARTQQTSPYTNESETVSTNQMATGSLSLTIPVAKNNTCKSLFNDIIKNNKDEVYTITMADGWSDGISENYIMANGTITFEAGKVVAMECVFQKNDGRLN